MDLDLALVAAQLATCSALKKAGVAADFAAAAGDIKAARLPAAYVVPLRDTASGNTFSTIAVAQEVTEEFLVIFAVSSLRDVIGKASADALRPVRIAVRDKLLGWSPDAASFDPFEFGGGRLLMFGDAVMWWQDTYRTRSRIRKT